MHRIDQNFTHGMVGRRLIISKPPCITAVAVFRRPPSPLASPLPLPLPSPLVLPRRRRRAGGGVIGGRATLFVIAPPPHKPSSSCRVHDRHCPPRPWRAGRRVVRDISAAVRIGGAGGGVATIENNRKSSHSAIFATIGTPYFWTPV